jgi:hypothetical protein
VLVAERVAFGMRGLVGGGMTVVQGHPAA